MLSIGLEFRFDQRRWRVISYRHDGSSFEAATVDDKSPFITRRFTGASVPS